MNLTCDSVQRHLSLFLYGELKATEEDRIQTHLESCESCRRALEKTTDLHHALDLAEPPVPDGLLVSARRGLQQTLAAQAEVQAELPLWSRLGSWLNGTWGWKPALAAGVVAISFFGGRATSVETASVVPELGPPAATRVRSVEPDPSGNGIQIALDETRQRVVSGRLDDPSITKLLLSAATDPNDPGLRAESVEMLSSRSEESQVRSALLDALEHDGNAAVRMKALSGLKSHSQDPNTRAVLARVLLNDSSPGVRSQVVDLLTEVQSQDMIAPLQELMRKEDNDYVRFRTQRALHEMKASPGIF